MSLFSLLHIDVEEPETSENPMQSFEIPNIVRRHTQLLAAIIYRDAPKLEFLAKTENEETKAEN